jgi:hypothetical protein
MKIAPDPGPYTPVLDEEERTVTLGANLHVAAVFKQKKKRVGTFLQFSKSVSSSLLNNFNLPCKGSA